MGSTFGVSLPLTWYPIDSVSVELRPAMAVASRRYTFYFDPDATVYTTPALLLRLGIGAAVRF
ncbi:MAG: hypothetical protein HOO96_03615 [Polyangiaceae bacterium]|nr:hypothetical protein [Polyangiaceae bacterium]